MEIDEHTLRAMQDAFRLFQERLPEIEKAAQMFADAQDNIQRLSLEIERMRGSAQLANSLGLGYIATPTNFATGTASVGPYPFDSVSTVTIESPASGASNPWIEVQQLQAEVAELRAEVAQLRRYGHHHWGYIWPDDPLDPPNGNFDSAEWN